MQYVIREWGPRYEVNDKNRALQQGDKMRAGALEYLRFPVHGRDWSLSYRRFLQVAKDNAPETYGVWVKCLEIAAHAEAGKRGVIRDDMGNPMGAKGIAESLGWPVKKVERALSILCADSVGWIEHSREIPGTPGNSPSETESDTETYTESETDAEGDIPPDPATGEESYRVVFDSWNRRVDELGDKGRIAKAAVLTPKRRNKLKTRWGEKFFRENWERGFDYIFTDHYCHGVNGSHWKASFDWIIRSSDSLVKQIERAESKGIMAPRNGVYVGDMPEFEEASAKGNGNVALISGAGQTNGAPVGSEYPENVLGHSGASNSEGVAA